MMRPWVTLALLPLLALCAAAPSRAAEAEQTVYVPAGWEGAYDFGYAPVLKVGETVIVSGVPAGGGGTYEEKIHRMYQRAKDLLQAAGATIEDVVELTTFHNQPQDPAAFRAEFDRYMPIHRQYFGEHRPAWTAVGTTALLSRTAVVEMRLVAVVGSGASRHVVRAEAPAPPEEAGPAAEEKPEG